jgi:hypothetical protein
VASDARSEGYDRNARGTAGAKRKQPANGPPIEEWESALIGRTRVKREAAFTTGSEMTSRSVSRQSVRGNLIFVCRHAEPKSSLSRIPVELIDRIEQILHDSVGCGSHTRSPSVENMDFHCRTTNSLGDFQTLGSSRGHEGTPRRLLYECNHRKVS